MVKIYHNPRCGKSRQTLKLIQEKGIEPEVFEYLKNPVDGAELKAILSMLDMKPLELIRRGEKIFKEEFKGMELSDDQWMDAMVANPILIERPIVINGSKAVLGRPPENVNEIL